jgi:O-antigen/teichoic acid export membrane protein
MILLSGGLACIVLVYSRVVVAFVNELSAALLGDHYTDIQFLTLAWCLYVGIFATRSIASTAVQAYMDFRLFFLSSIAGSVVALGLALLLIYLLGSPGAVLGMAAGELAAAVILWSRVRDHAGPVAPVKP